MSNCDGAYATAQEFADFWCLGYALSSEEEATINVFLELAASDIHVALGASNMCECTLATWATGYLEKLNIIDSAAYYNCPCANPKLSEDMRARLIEWMNLQLELIRTMQIELCAGATGTDFPAIGIAQMSVTDMAGARIIFDYERKTG